MSGILNITGRIAVVTSLLSGNSHTIALTLATEGTCVVCSNLTPEVYSKDYKQLNKIVNKQVSAFDKTMTINTQGVFLGMKYTITQIMKQAPLPSGERGWIINITSISASYCASKGAVVNLTRQVAVDYAPEKIHINAVCPGFLATAMVRSFLEGKETNAMLHSQSPWPHLGTAEDVAKAVLVLSSPAASWMTGSFINVDGGFLAK
ncbi:hypothetical protein ASPBRDRAFT_60022 [Aspergillus brasiliensis CBS 101740]|uniref:Uncharacterized protein n=1 Tax=Aspergillus brasiliensis (strain CBS 101740 / IMI 381727 / IBT 21946) TaxID=767769 RepID=A0A1L9U3C2_ASPBC|nr:hypothetical protein ASPBRDRAFT_60022 [Aspergillus brasiliensis CBS 101740]